MEGNTYIENTLGFDCTRSQAPPISPLLPSLDGEDQGPPLDSPQSQQTRVPLESDTLIYYREQSSTMAPCRMDKLDLAHRVVLPPLTWSTSYGIVSQPHAHLYYIEKATPGGLLIAEATRIPDTAPWYRETPGIWTKEQVEAWQPIVKGVHDKGAFFFCQIWHVGRVSNIGYQPNNGQDIISHTDKTLGSETGCSPPRGWLIEEIPAIINNFRRAARNAIDAGFDGVEIYGANGYILGQLIEDHFDDDNGGSLENRCRFASEVVEAVVKEIGCDKVGIWLSSNGDFMNSGNSDPDPVGLYMARTLSKYDIAYFHTGCTKNLDEEICALPVIERKSKLAEVLAARRKQTSTDKPTEIHRISLGELPKLSKPKLNSVCNATKIIQTHANVTRVAPTCMSSFGVKAKGREMLKSNFCGSNAKVGGLMKKAARRKLISTVKPTDCLRRPGPPILSKPKLASICSANKIIQTKASVVCVAHTDMPPLGVKAKGKEIMKRNFCASNGKVAGLLKEKVAVGKLSSTIMPNEILRRPFAEAPKLYKPKLASICSTTKIIGTKASVARIAPTYMSSLSVARIAPQSQQTHVPLLQESDTLIYYWEQSSTMAPYRLGKLDLTQRVVLPPLTWSTSYGNVSQPHAQLYYIERATPGGLLIAEATCIRDTAPGYPETLGIWTKEQVEAWKPIVKGVHDKGAFFFCQIWHVERVSNIGSETGCSSPKGLLIEEIPAIINDFRRAARNAIDAGFDGVEIYGANGYLIGQLIKDHFDDRIDDNGGSLENSCRFASEVVEAVVKEIGCDKVGIWLSSNGDFMNSGNSDSDPLGLYLAQTLSKYDIAYFHTG